MSEHIEIGVTSLQSALDCPLCFWLSEKVGSPPSIIAGITVQMDSVIKEYMRQFIGSSRLPSWFPVRGTLLDTKRAMRAKDQSTGITLKGILDALVRTPEGEYIVIDYKTGKPPKEIPNYYQMQLDGYAYLLEQNDLKPVGGGVLLYFTPAHGDISEGFFPFKITAVRARVDPSRIPPALAQAKKILDMDLPPARSEDCQMCMWLEQVRQILSE